jgi:hypothetical protein
VLSGRGRARERGPGIALLDQNGQRAGAAAKVERPLPGLDLRAANQLAARLLVSPEQLHERVVEGQEGFVAGGRDEV